MNHHDAPLLATRPWRLGLAVALLAVAAAIAFFSASFVLQAFRGPRTITEQELLAVGEPSSFDNYVSYTPPKPFIDTGLVWGKKNNPGTKYVLLPAGDRLVLCSARIANNGPTFVGRLHAVSGGPAEEVYTGAKASYPSPAGGSRVMPVMLQAVRSIWFDTAVALVFGLGTGAGGLALLIAALRTKTSRDVGDRPRRRPARDERRADEEY